MVDTAGFRCIVADGRDNDGIAGLGVNGNLVGAGQTLVACCIICIVSNRSCSKVKAAGSKCVNTRCLCSGSGCARKCIGKFGNGAVICIGRNCNAGNGGIQISGRGHILGNISRTGSKSRNDIVRYIDIKIGNLGIRMVVGGAPAYMGDSLVEYHTVERAPATRRNAGKGICL